MRVARVKLIGFIVVPEADLTAVEAELPDHIRLTRAEPGCISFDVAQSHSDPRRFEVAEAFRDRAAFDEHQLRVRQSRWGRVASNAERHYEITEEAD